MQNSPLPSQEGSFGRGTALRGGCDFELVIFFGCFESFEDQRARRAEILKETRGLLDAWCRNPIPGLRLQLPEQDTPGVLWFQLASEDLENRMDVQLVPAFDVLGEGSLPPSRVGGGSLGGDRSPRSGPATHLLAAWAGLDPSLSPGSLTEPVGGREG